MQVGPTDRPYVHHAGALRAHGQGSTEDALLDWQIPHPAHLADRRGRGPGAVHQLQGPDLATTARLIEGEDSDSCGEPATSSTCGEHCASCAEAVRPAEAGFSAQARAEAYS